MPRRGRLWPRATQVTGKCSAELARPAADGLVGDLDATLREQILHIPQAQGEPEVEPDGVADHLRREAVALIRDGRHSSRLPVVTAPFKAQQTLPDNAKAVGNQLYIVFALGILLVHLVLAAQYESWLSPVSVILAVPLSLVGPVVGLSAVGADNNLYTQIGIILLVALSAKNAILIVEVAREGRGLPAG
jgi:hypothetical protein